MASIDTAIEARKANPDLLQDKHQAHSYDEKPESEDNSASEDGEVDENFEISALLHVKPDEIPAAQDIPPLPSEPPPAGAREDVDDGWAPVWEETTQAFYFYNRFTGATQWTNPRVPEASSSGPPGVDPPSQPSTNESPPAAAVTGYNPAIHGDYDSNAWYAQPSQNSLSIDTASQPPDPAAQYAATAAFNRFTGRFQNAEITPENFNDENKSKRQMNAFFDVDAAANSHDGRSLKAERSGKKLSKTELKQFKEKRKMKKEEKRRAWLRD